MYTLRVWAGGYHTFQTVYMITGIIRALLPDGTSTEVCLVLIVLYTVSSPRCAFGEGNANDGEGVK